MWWAFNINFMNDIICLRTNWNYIDVRDFEILKNIYQENVLHGSLEKDIKDLGDKLKTNLGLDYPYLDAAQSKYTLDLYDETINLGLTYFRQ